VLNGKRGRGEGRTLATNWQKCQQGKKKMDKGGEGEGKFRLWTSQVGKPEVMWEREGNGHVLVRQGKGGKVAIHQKTEKDQRAAEDILLGG